MRVNSGACPFALTWRTSRPGRMCGKRKRPSLSVVVYRHVAVERHLIPTGFDPADLGVGDRPSLLVADLARDLDPARHDLDVGEVAERLHGPIVGRGLRGGGRLPCALGWDAPSER